MTNQELIALAKRHGATVYTNRHYVEKPAIALTVDKFQALLAKVVAAEWEACAKLCDSLMETTFELQNASPYSAWIEGTINCAAAIRARGKQ